MMYETSSQIQRTDFTTTEASEVISQLEFLLHVFDEHAHHEDKYLLPHVLKHVPHLVESFEKDHVTDHQLSEDLRGHVTEWKNAADITAQQAAGNHIFYAFNDFIAFNLYHMNREEHELLFTLWQHYTDAEIMAMQNQIIQSIAPETMMAEVTWMMRAMSNPEIIGWMKGVQATAPAPMYEALQGIAQKELSPERWNGINEILNAPAVVV